MLLAVPAAVAAAAAVLPRFLLLWLPVLVPVLFPQKRVPLPIVLPPLQLKGAEMLLRQGVRLALERGQEPAVAALLAFSVYLLFFLFNFFCFV